jgi:phage repressor protein C with HTH and peptisase S24 domain
MVDASDPLTAEDKALGRAMRAIRERKRMTQAVAAANLGVAPQAWQRYEAGERKPKGSRLGEIAAALEVTLDELLAERQAILGGRQGGEVLAGPGQVGVYGFAAAAGETIALAAGSEIRFVSMHPAQKGYRRIGAAEIVGESMYPRYKPRELAYFVFDLTPPRGDDVIAEMQNGEAIIKEYVGQRDGQVMFKEFFPEERVFGIEATKVKALHAVVGR